MEADEGNNLLCRGTGRLVFFSFVIRHDGSIACDRSTIRRRVVSLTSKPFSSLNSVIRDNPRDMHTVASEGQQQLVPDKPAVIFSHNGKLKDGCRPATTCL